MTTTAMRGWAVKHWCVLAATSRAELYKELKAGRIKAKKRGHSTIIVTPPEEYLAALPDYQPRSR